MNVLAIGCHPDDLEINCGGTLAKCVKRGDKVTMVTLANGSAGHQILSKEEIVKVRLEEGKRAADVIGADYYCLGLDDMFVRKDYDIGVRRVSDIIRMTRPGEAGLNLHHTRATMSVPPVLPPLDMERPIPNPAMIPPRKVHISFPLETANS